MRSSNWCLVLFGLALGFASASSGCDENGASQESISKVGKVDLALTGTSASGKLYRLRNGVIEILRPEITGPAIATIDTEDNPGAGSVELELKAGVYLAALSGGWTLERAIQGTTTFQPVEAVLVRPNPRAFTIKEELTTHVRLLFNAGEPVELENDGRAVVEIGINDCSGMSELDCDLDGDGAPATIDCDDFDPLVHPTPIADTCDGVDNNCDGQIDEHAGGNCFDLDHDGFFGYWEDCDDHDPSIFRGAMEVCDGRDNNCDWRVDEIIICGCRVGDLNCDFDGDGTIGHNDCDDSNPFVNPFKPEVCDRLDNDCNGQIDENLDCPFCGFEPEFGPNHPCWNGLYDRDGDGIVRAADCDDGDWSTFPGAPESCDGRDNNCNGRINENLDCDFDDDGSPGLTDCDDLDPLTFAGAVELCDGKDNDCNGLIDDAVGDGLGCNLDRDRDYFPASIDCNDSHSFVYPGASERCDGLDNDCNGLVDDSQNLDCDGDGDGVGFIDCNDSNPSIHQGAAELCDGLDNDCNGMIDDAENVDCDADGDGFPKSVDCDDLNVYMFPGASERCDPWDNDCNGLVNEANICGCFLGASDCPGEPCIEPGTPEVCDGRDNDCNGLVNEDGVCNEPW